MRHCLCVHDAKAAYERALNLGAWAARRAGRAEHSAIKGIGDSLIYPADAGAVARAQPGDIGNIGFFDVDFQNGAGRGQRRDALSQRATA